MMSTQGSNLSQFLDCLRQAANHDAPVPKFLRDIIWLIRDFVNCDAVEIWVERGDRCVRCEAKRKPSGYFHMVSQGGGDKVSSPLLASVRKHRTVDQICQLVIEKEHTATHGLLNAAGSFCTSCLDETRRSLPRDAGRRLFFEKNPVHGSLAVLPLFTANDIFGLLVLKHDCPHPLVGSDLEVLHEIAVTLASTLSSQFAHSALHERVKELTCLYQLSLLTENPDTTLDEVLQGIAGILPAAWQYPDITAARIEWDGRHYDTDNFSDETAHVQSAEIVLGGVPRGFVRVAYLIPCFELDEGPFLREERALIDAVARQIAQIIEQRQAASEKLRLQSQLQHADRLATIGQLAAGVAHELNEPLGNILAFSQLAEKQKGVPKQVTEDLAKIVKASLHAREIIKKLMLFARQTPPQKRLTDLNKLVDEGLYFLESRCGRNGITVKRQLSRNLPKVRVDPGQINQVLVNLIVNAIQAMPQGGSLKISTRQQPKSVSLLVEDTGMGMTSDVLDKIFVPFFTTKDVNQGTGLGLPVAHGIVTAHGGRIDVRTQLNKGSRFEVTLPRPRRAIRKGTARDR